MSKAHELATRAGELLEGNRQLVKILAEAYAELCGKVAIERELEQLREEVAYARERARFLDITDRKIEELEQVNGRLRIERDEWKRRWEDFKAPFAPFYDLRDEAYIAWQGCGHEDREELLRRLCGLGEMAVTTLTEEQKRDLLCRRRERRSAPD